MSIWPRSSGVRANSTGILGAAFRTALSVKNSPSVGSFWINFKNSRLSADVTNLVFDAEVATKVKDRNRRTLAARMVHSASYGPNAPVQARWAHAQRADPSTPNPPTVACNRLLGGAVRTYGTLEPA